MKLFSKFTKYKAYKIGVNMSLDNLYKIFIKEDRIKSKHLLIKLKYKILIFYVYESILSIPLLVY
jgi:hypothetical protein